MSSKKPKTSVSSQSETLIIKRVERFNKMLLRFENEIEKVVGRLVKRGKRSQLEVKRNFEDLLKRIMPGKIAFLAHETREELEKELRKLSEEAIQSLKDFENHMQAYNVKGVFKNAKIGLSNILDVLGASEIVDQARLRIETARRDILGILSIPTQKDVELLERKIINLEKRLSTLTRKAA